MNNIYKIVFEGRLTSAPRTKKYAFVSYVTRFCKDVLAQRGTGEPIETKLRLPRQSSSNQ